MIAPIGLQLDQLLTMQPQVRVALTFPISINIPLIEIKTLHKSHFALVGEPLASIRLFPLISALGK